jgi:hypothetical protein
MIACSYCASVGEARCVELVLPRSHPHGCGRRGQGPERDRGQERAPPPLRNFGVRNSLGFAYDASPNWGDTALSSNHGPAMFATLVLVGHAARRARKLARGATIWPHVHLYMRNFPL